MRDLTSRSKHTSDRVSEPYTGCNPCRNSGCIHAPCDICSGGREDTRPLPCSPIRAIIRVEYCGASVAVAVSERGIAEIRREYPIALAYCHPESCAELVLPKRDVIALSSKVRGIAHTYPGRHIIGICDTIRGRPRDRPHEGDPDRHPHGRPQRIHAIRDTIDGVEERGLGTHDGGPVDAIGRICERVTRSVATGHPVSIYRRPCAAISVGDGAHSRGGGGAARVQERRRLVILFIRHRVCPDPASGVVRRRGNRAAILGY